AARRDRRRQEKPASVAARAALAQYGLIAFQASPCTITTIVSESATSDSSPVSLTCPTTESSRTVRNTRACGLGGTGRHEISAGATVQKCPAIRSSIRWPEAILGPVRRSSLLHGDRPIRAPQPACRRALPIGRPAFISDPLPQIVVSPPGARSRALYRGFLPGSEARLDTVPLAFTTNNLGFDS